jgi:hypothetical protein
MKVTLKAAKTYATEANAEAAVAKAGLSDLRYMIIQKDGRFFPIFALNQGGFTAIERGVHFKFCVFG